jgi:hypothetical protein
MEERWDDFHYVSTPAWRHSSLGLLARRWRISRPLRKSVLPVAVSRWPVLLLSPLLSGRSQRLKLET